MVLRDARSGFGVGFHPPVWSGHLNCRSKYGPPGIASVAGEINSSH